jgi:hypothetical protein
MTGPTPHFTWNELTVRKRIPGADLARLTPAVRVELARIAACAEVIRAHVGKPIRVTSAFRAGDPRQHGQGQAMDIQVDGMSPMELLRIVRELDMPHPLRQVIAETVHGSRADLDRDMGEGSGQWLHIAVRGLERYDTSSDLPWGASWDPPTASRAYVAV